MTVSINLILFSYKCSTWIVFVSIQPLIPREKHDTIESLNLIAFSFFGVSWGSPRSTFRGSKRKTKQIITPYSLVSKFRRSISVWWGKQVSISDHQLTVSRGEKSVMNPKKGRKNATHAGSGTALHFHLNRECTGEPGLVIKHHSKVIRMVT